MSILRRCICCLRGHDWDNNTFPGAPGYWCNRCRRYLP